MIQADSLSRIAPSCVPDMLVLDEIESILTQMTSKNCSRGGVYDSFKVLLQRSKHVIVLDGFLQQATIDLLNSIRKREHIIYENVTAPYTAVPCSVIVTNEKNSVMATIIDTIKLDRQNQQRSVVHITSINQAKALEVTCKNLGYRTLTLHGDNLVYNEEHQQYHAEFKQNVIPTLNRTSE